MTLEHSTSFGQLKVKSDKASEIFFLDFNVINIQKLKLE